MATDLASAVPISPCSLSDTCPAARPARLDTCFHAACCSVPARLMAELQLRLSCASPGLLWRRPIPGPRPALPLRLINTAHAHVTRRSPARRCVHSLQSRTRRAALRHSALAGVLCCVGMHGAGPEGGLSCTSGDDLKGGGGEVHGQLVGVENWDESANPAKVARSSGTLKGPLGYVGPEQGSMTILTRTFAGSLGSD